MQPKKARESVIEVAADGLPRWRSEDVEFVRRKLRARELDTKKSAPDISAFIRDEIGVDPRGGTNDGPSAVYYRVRAAFRDGLRRGIFKRVGRQWGVADGATAKAS